MTPPTGTVPLVVDTKFPPLRWTAALRQPVLIIDGHQIPVGWGRTVLSVVPGIHQVQIRVRGSDARMPPITIDTRLGPQTVYYAASWTPFVSGRAGTQPVSSPGAGVRIAVALAPLLIILLCAAGCIVALFAGVLRGAAGH